MAPGDTRHPVKVVLARAEATGKCLLTLEDRPQPSAGSPTEAQGTVRAVARTPSSPALAPALLWDPGKAWPALASFLPLDDQGLEFFESLHSYTFLKLPMIGHSFLYTGTAASRRGDR